MGEDEAPPTTPCQRDVVDGRYDDGEDSLVHPQVVEEKIFIAAKEVDEEVVPPTTKSSCIILDGDLRSIVCLHHHYIS